MGGRRLRGAKLCRLLSEVPGRRSPPPPSRPPHRPARSPQRRRGSLTKVSLRNLPAAAASPWKRPPHYPPLPTGRGGEEAEKGGSREGARAAFSPAGWLRGRVPKPCRVAGTGSPTAGREKRQAEPRDGDTAPSPPPAEVSCLPWGERGESPGALSASPHPSATSPTGA